MATGLVTATESWEARVQDPETGLWTRKFFEHPHSAAGWILEHVPGESARAWAMRQFIRAGRQDRKALTPLRHITLHLSGTLEGGHALDRRLMQAVAAEAGLRGVHWRGEVYPARPGAAPGVPRGPGVILKPCMP